MAQHPVDMLKSLKDKHKILKFMVHKTSQKTQK